LIGFQEANAIRDAVQAQIEGLERCMGERIRWMSATRAEKASVDAAHVCLSVPIPEIVRMISERLVHAA